MRRAGCSAAPRCPERAHGSIAVPDRRARLSRARMPRRFAPGRPDRKVCPARWLEGRPTMAKAARVGLLLGDPCGIGPELVARLVAGGELDPDAATIVIGEPRLLARGARHAGVELRLAEVASPDEADPRYRGAAARAIARPGRGAGRSGERRRGRLRARRVSPGARAGPGRRARCALLCALQQAGDARGRPRVRGRAALLRPRARLRRLRRRDQRDRRPRHHARHLARAAARGRRPDHRGRRAGRDPPRRIARCAPPASTTRASRSPGSIPTPATAACSGARRSR